MLIFFLVPDLTCNDISENSPKIMLLHTSKSSQYTIKNNKIAGLAMLLHKNNSLLLLVILFFFF